ncbi:hypothetical protein [Nonomuraea angiospora]|uniref:hypothetical protein n=1 Tax=Nonomuraea angiospora TaxID=46172 RepID=UPI0029BE97FE|nr:hypothetical protein [Nonomuraea angiospora]MDX3109706.1 hypothetical protein [Nonomuraea angiospora]
MTRSETLRTIAARMREAGDAATPGPWRVVKHERRQHPGVLANVDLHKPGGTVRSISWKVPGEIADAEWSALAHPGLAKPLPDLLETVADLIDARPELERPHVDGEPCDDLACRIVHLALATAAILGGNS